MATFSTLSDSARLGTKLYKIGLEPTAAAGRTARTHFSSQDKSGRLEAEHGRLSTNISERRTILYFESVDRMGDRAREQRPISSLGEGLQTGSRILIPPHDWP